MTLKIKTKAEHRLRFDDADLKAQLEELAAAADLSLNGLINKILAAQFSEVDRKSMQLLHDLVELKNIPEFK